MTVTGVQGALELARYQRSQNGMFVVRFPEDIEVSKLGKIRGGGG